MIHHFNSFSSKILMAKTAKQYLLAIMEQIPYNIKERDTGLSVYNQPVSRLLTLFN